MTPTPIEIPSFDSEKTYDNEIRPLLRALCDKCKEHKLPVIIAVCYKISPPGNWHAGAMYGRDGAIPPEFWYAQRIIQGKAGLMKFEEGLS
jgi:hypothetical protein